jgi:hypothetical protein
MISVARGITDMKNLPRSSPPAPTPLCALVRKYLNHEAQVDGKRQITGIIWHCEKWHIHSARNSSRICLLAGASRTSTASRTAPDKSLSSQLRMIKFNARRQNAQILHSRCPVRIYSEEYHTANGRGSYGWHRFSGSVCFRPSVDFCLANRRPQTGRNMTCIRAIHFVNERRRAHSAGKLTSGCRGVHVLLFHRIPPHTPVLLEGLQDSSSTKKFEIHN